MRKCGIFGHGNGNEVMVGVGVGFKKKKKKKSATQKSNGRGNHLVPGCANRRGKHRYLAILLANDDEQELRVP